MKTLEQLLTIGSYAGLGLFLSCTSDTADNKDSSSEPCVAWEQTYDREEKSYRFYDAQQTTDGGYVLVGVRYSEEGHFDGLLVKTNVDGIKEWEHPFDRNDIEEIYSVEQTNDEGYILAGYTESSDIKQFDGWIIKIAVDGSTQWEQTVGGNSYEGFYSGQQTIDGGYVFAGYTDSLKHGWFVKIDENGNPLWEKTFGEGFQGSIVVFSSIQQTTDGGYILAGYTGDLDPDALEVVTTYGLLIKTDADGNTLWEQKFNRSGMLDKMYAVQQTADEGYILAGESMESSGIGYYDGWILKTDENGNPLWEQTYGERARDEVITSIHQTVDEGYVLAGQRGSSGLFIETDIDGNKQREETFEEDGYTTFSSVMQTMHGDYALAGQTGSSGLLVKVCDL